MSNNEWNTEMDILREDRDIYKDRYETLKHRVIILRDFYLAGANMDSMLKKLMELENEIN